MRQALDQAKQALFNGEFPVGCVFVDDGEAVAFGSRQNSSTGLSGQANEMDHAEIVGLRQLLEKIDQVDIGRVTVYSTMEPCLMCYSTLLLNGIRNFVYGYEDVMGGGTSLPLDQLNPLYSSMHVSIESGVMREQSLKLFYDFFSSAEKTYWQGSLLASYTLEQGKMLSE